jgi:GTP-binding protein HflX
VTISLDPGRPRAVLVSVQLTGVSDADHRSSLDELGRLVDTLGFTVIGEVSQKRGRPAPAAGLGGGKLKELAVFTGGTGVIPSGAIKKKQRKDLHKVGAAPMEADEDDDDDDDDDAALTGEGAVDLPPQPEKATVVVVDIELSPSQMRNIEKATGVEVLDRNGVIIEIFSRHARTKEAQMQVEIARLQYEAPRLREKEHTGDRQRGGGVGGIGEDELEMDRRKIRDRIAELKEKLEELEKEDLTKRQRRMDSLRVALVGYTNAGKSSLMRALSGHDVLVADKLFATLGTTVRAIPNTVPRVLVSDTVGFIKNLPHALVASFRSTLDEAHEARLLLFVVDASDPAFPSQLEVTKKVLAEIGADDIPSLLILNKIDRVDEVSRARLRRDHPHAVQLSALNADDVAALKVRLDEHFADTLETAPIDVPHARAGQILGFVHEHLRVLEENWDEWGLRLTVRGTPEVLAQLRGTIGEVGKIPPRTVAS